MSAEQQALAANRQAQRDLYGETLEQRISSLTRGYGVSQRRLAQALGISAPMLSQLVSARRVKMGNTLAYERMVTLGDRLGEAVDPAAAEQILQEVAASDVVTTMQMRSRPGPAHGSPEQGLVDAVGTSQLRAAGRLLMDHDVAPELVALIDRALADHRDG